MQTNKIQSVDYFALKDWLKALTPDHLLAALKRCPSPEEWLRLKEAYPILGHLGLGMVSGNAKIAASAGCYLCLLLELIRLCDSEFAESKNGL